MKHDFIDKYSNLNSVVHKIDPRIKLLLLFCFLIFIAVTSNLKLLGFYWGIAAVLYTYIFIFIDELHRIMRAFKNRTAMRRVSRLKVYGHIAAGILLRSMDRSEYIYKAMLSRGFDEEFPEGNANRLKWTDLAAVIVFFGIIVTTRLLWDM